METSAAANASAALSTSGSVIAAIPLGARTSGAPAGFHPVLRRVSDVHGRDAFQTRILTATTHIALRRMRRNGQLRRVTSQTRTGAETVTATDRDPDISRTSGDVVRLAFMG